MLASPFGHPEVRRGVERYCRDLGGWLAGRGHEVTWCFSASEAGRRVTDDGLRVIAARRGDPFGAGRLRVDEPLRSAVGTWRAIRRLDADSVQAFHHASAATAAHAVRPVVFTLPGVPRPESLGGRLLHRLAFRHAIDRADHLTCLSAYARDSLRRHFDLDAEVLPPGVAVDRWGGVRPDGPPIVVCTAAVGDPRKQVDVLLRAVPLVRRHRPDVEFVLAPPDVEAAHALVRGLAPEVRAAVRVLECPDRESLARCYRSAALAVLPSVEEAFGLVLVEALAAGTPVVGSDHGAIPEVIDDDAIGRRFVAGDADALARSVVDAFELTADASTAERCRRHARRWDWSTVGPAHEELHARAAR